MFKPTSGSREVLFVQDSVETQACLIVLLSHRKLGVFLLFLLVDAKYFFTCFVPQMHGIILQMSCVTITYFLNIQVVSSGLTFSQFVYNWKQEKQRQCSNHKIDSTHRDYCLVNSSYYLKLLL